MKVQHISNEFQRKLAEEVEARGSVKLSYFVIDGIPVPFIADTGVIVSGVRSTTVKATLDGAVSLTIEAMSYHPEGTEDDPPRH